MYIRTSFITLGPCVNVIKLFSLSLTVGQDKIECYSSASFFGLV
jgi:hypothetical protein